MHDLDPGPAGEVGDQLVGAVVGIDQDPGAPAARRASSGQVDQRPPGRGQQRLGHDPGQRRQPRPGPRGQAEPDHRGGASGAIPPTPALAEPVQPLQRRRLGRGRVGVEHQHRSRAGPAGRRPGRRSVDRRRAAGGGWVEQQRPPGPGLVDRGPQGHRARPLSTTSTGRPSPARVRIWSRSSTRSRNPGPRRARPSPVARAGRGRPPARTGPGTWPRGGHRLDRRARVGMEDQERPGPGAGQLGDRDRASSPAGRHARQLRWDRRPGW